MSLLETASLTLKIAEKTILKEIDFTVEKGEIVGLMGPNGTGKTTLLKALAGLSNHKVGKILFDGKDMIAMHRQDLAQKLAYLPQGHDVHWSMSVENVVMLGRLPHLKPWQRPTKKDWHIIRQVLEKCDAWQFAQRSIQSLSGGERARVLLARALAVQPQILLADEPLAGLDPGHQLEIMGYLQQQAKEGLAVVIVIHDLNLARRFCHRVVLLGQQRVLVQGPVDDVMVADKISRCFSIRVVTGNIQKIPVVIPVESLNNHSIK